MDIHAHLKGTFLPMFLLFVILYKRKPKFGVLTQKKYMFAKERVVVQFKWTWILFFQYKNFDHLYYH